LQREWSGVLWKIFGYSLILHIVMILTYPPLYSGLENIRPRRSVPGLTRLPSLHVFISNSS
jgi:hypothetical protein